MKTYTSLTTNKGKVVVLDSMEEAICIGRSYLSRQLDEAKSNPAATEMKVRTVNRDTDPQTTTQTWGQRLKRLTESCRVFESCVTSLGQASDDLTDAVQRSCETLIDLVKEIEPSLVGAYQGFRRANDGIDVLPELLCAGNDRPFLQRQVTDGFARQSRRGQSYRLVLSTDTTWFGRPEDNAAVVGAIVLLLQQFGPVEVWIQQGWLGDAPDDGVTLFSLDSSTGFDVALLAFWTGHPLKDSCFSFWINMALGRNSGGSAKCAEIPADLFLRGDWMKTYGIDEGFDKLLHTERMDILSKWIADTAFRVINSDGEDQINIAI